MHHFTLRAGISVCLIAAVICSPFLPADVPLNDILSFEKVPSFSHFPIAAVGAPLMNNAVKIFCILSTND